MSDDLQYLTGFGNHLMSEAEPGAVPHRQNGPHHTPYGLMAELINGTGFTVERGKNLRTWMYRLRPAIHDRGFTLQADAAPRWVSRFDDAVALPEVQRYAPTALPEGEVDLIDGMQTFAGAGDPALKRGVAVHVFAATADMDRVFCNIDGDLLLAPEIGRVRVQTELGWLEAAPGEILVLPRGIRFRASLPDGPVRGFAAELYDGHFQLPERGPVGSNGLADERHFRAPVAAYEDVVEDTEIVAKQGGRFWRTVAPNSPFDVVGWHGTYHPYVYDLDDFMSIGSVSFDHPDPSILTVLTSPMDTHGRNAIDVAVFRGRWDPTEHTFRPPFFHRNSAIEFNGVLKSPGKDGPYRAGVFSYTPYLTPHGVSSRSQRGELRRTDDSPHRLSDDSLWIQFESTYVLKVLPRWLDHASRDGAFLDNFRDWQLGELTSG